MTLLKDIMDLIAEKELSSVEISAKLGIKSDNCSSYLNTLMKDGRIIRIEGKRPFIYKKADKPIELLKQLYTFMSNKCELKEFDDFDIKLIEIIKRMIS
jgi:predicted transcriptional regulator